MYWTEILVVKYGNRNWSKLMNPPLISCMSYEMIYRM